MPLHLLPRGRPRGSDRGRLLHHPIADHHIWTCKLRGPPCRPHRQPATTATSICCASRRQPTVVPRHSAIDFASAAACVAATATRLPPRCAATNVAATYATKATWTTLPTATLASLSSACAAATADTAVTLAASPRDASPVGA